MEPGSIFQREGDRFVPSDLARGPWRADTQHGSPVLGLLARAAEHYGGAETDRPAQVARLSVDLLRAAPMAPIEIETRQVRRGGMLEVLELRLCSGGVEYARASALRSRIEEIDTSAYRDGFDSVAPPDPPADSRCLPTRRGRIFFPHSLDMRASGGPEGGSVWFRLRVALVAGEAPSPLVRAAVASDFAYSTPVLLRRLIDPDFPAERDFVTINPDTTIHLHRPPEGEWLALESRARFGGLGAGSAVATLWDTRGAAGHVSQSILVRKQATRGMSYSTDPATGSEPES